MPLLNGRVIGNNSKRSTQSSDCERLKANIQTDAYKELENAEWWLVRAWGGEQRPYPLHGI